MNFKMKKYSGKSSKHSDELFTQFRNASRQICDDLNVSHDGVKAERYETPSVGISYSAVGNNSECEFTFYLKTETKEKDVLSGKMSASLDIYYSKGSAPFSFYESLDSLKLHPDFLERWTAWAVHNFNLKHNPANLESLFHEMDIRVYGLPRYTIPTMGEAHMLIGGIRQFPPNNLLIYRFRHVDPQVKYRSFSYAFLVSHNNIHSFWVFFPNCGGLDSGGASGDLHTLEELISSVKTKSERKDLDIKYGELEKFLQKKAISFRLEYERDDIQISFIDPSENAFGKDFIQLYTKFRERYQAGDYSGALRDLRAVVQEAMQLTCEKKKVDLGSIQKRKIGNLSEKMKKSNIIDEDMYNWFLAFSSVANKASHGGFPTKKDLENSTLRRKIMTTFLLGNHLVEELENILIPPKPIERVTRTEFKVNITANPVPVEQTFHETLDGL